MARNGTEVIVDRLRTQRSTLLLGLLGALALVGAGCGEDTTTVAAPTNPYA